jgi:hypothetical protein
MKLTPRGRNATHFKRHALRALRASREVVTIDRLEVCESRDVPGGALRFSLMRCSSRACCSELICRTMLAHACRQRRQIQ